MCSWSVMSLASIWHSECMWTPAGSNWHEERMTWGCLSIMREMSTAPTHVSCGTSYCLKLITSILAGWGFFLLNPGRLSREPKLSWEALPYTLPIMGIVVKRSTCLFIVIVIIIIITTITSKITQITSPLPLLLSTYCHYRHETNHQTLLYRCCFLFLFMLSSP